MRKLLGMLMCAAACLILGVGAPGCTKKKVDEKKTEEKKTTDTKTETKKTDEKKTTTDTTKTEEMKTEEKKTDTKPPITEEKKTEEKKTDKGAFLAPASRELFANQPIIGVHATRASVQAILPRDLRG
jgi:hypothetical protein